MFLEFLPGIQYGANAFMLLLLLAFVLALDWKTLKHVFQRYALRT
jgi:hypothetical protein